MQSETILLMIHIDQLKEAYVFLRNNHLAITGDKNFS